MFLNFFNVAVKLKVLWSWSTSAKRMRQKRKRKEWTIMEPFCNVKWAIIRRTFGHGRCREQISVMKVLLR